MTECYGPCLEHCFSRDNIKYYIYGIITGLSISYIYNEYKQNHKNK